MEYNKSAVGEEKIVPVKEVLANICDVQNVYMADELAELLPGPHGQRYQKNIDMVDKLKKSIVAQEGTEGVDEGTESEPTTLFERLEQERLEEEKLETQSTENQKLDVQHHKNEEMEVLHHLQQELEVQCHKDDEIEALHHPLHPGMQNIPPTASTSLRQQDDPKSKTFPRVPIPVYTVE